MINCPYLDWIQLLLVAVWCECQVKVNVCLNHVKYFLHHRCCTLRNKRPYGHVCCSDTVLLVRRPENRENKTTIFNQAAVAQKYMAKCIFEEPIVR